jgi:hypothetical protein
MKRDNRSRILVLAAIVWVAFVPGNLLFAHGTEARYVDIANWKKEHFTKVFGTNQTHLDGVQARGGATIMANGQTVYRAKDVLQMRTFEGKSCILDDIIAFDVDDKYAYDIDEPVKFTITYMPELSSPFVIGWDKNGGTGQGVTPEIVPEMGATFRTMTVTLDRARLAGQGTQGSDIAIGSKNGIALCDIKIERSNSTKSPTAYGQVKLSVKDAKTGASVPARVGIYDSTGRAPLASGKALMLQRFADDLRMLAVNERTFWPSENRQAFYMDGNYDAKLPVGTYELVVTRGPEFHAYRGKFEVKENQTSTVPVTLTRYADLPSKGWYSGDSHIHLTRDVVADPVVWGMVAAEDVYVGNLLEMGNIAGTHFKQPKEWGKASRFERDGHFIVSGQEDPRSSFMGHTIHHNIQTPIHPPSNEFFLYDKVFAESHRQGGTSGFAHMGWGQAGSDPAGNNPFQMNRGVALLAPFAMIDFLEVLQRGRMLYEGWYRLLNLGYHISPAAGSDWPYSDFPGIVRNYVKLDGPLNLDKWFESFHNGHVYVTDGPFLDFTVNGRQMGEELHVKKGARLDIVAGAQLNPDVDTLDRMELVVLGDVAQTESAKGKDQIALKKQMTADHSMWIAVRAYGGRQDPTNMTIAHTAPIYVVVEDEPTWKPDAVPKIVTELRAQLQKMLIEPIEATGNNEYWETRTMMADEWLLQRPLLKPRVAAADRRYQLLLDQLAKFESTRASTKTSAL